MAKVPHTAILKPGAVLEVKLIDWNDPEIKALAAETRRQQKIILSYKNVTRKQLEQVINI